MNLSLFNSLCYTAGWLWCVYWGIHGHTAIAASGAIFLILVQLYCIKQKDNILYMQDLLLVFFSIPLGFLLEMVFIHTDLIRYVNSKNFPPIWIILLYPLFSLLISHSFNEIKRNYFILFLFGFFGAPLSYISGHSLGGLFFSYPFALTWILLGICWGGFLCLLAKVANQIEKATRETIKDRDSTDVVEMLYDGDCPICNHEVCALQKREHHPHIKFINIASKEILSEKDPTIDYETAMSQIHVKDSKGTFLIGLDAFAVIYARTHLLLLSTLLRLPFIKSILNPFYKLFAKNRLWLTGRALKK